MSEAGHTLSAITVATREQIAEGCMRRCEVGDRAYVVFNVDGTYYAAQDVCPHKGAPLSAGDLEGDVVICPLHAWEFNVRTGECVSMPEWPSLAPCSVQVDGDLLRLVIADEPS